MILNERNLFRNNKESDILVCIRMENDYDIGFNSLI